MRTTVPFYEIKDRMRKAVEGMGVAVRKEDDPRIPGEPFMSMEQGVHRLAEVAQHLIAEHTREVRMERITATGIAISAFSALAAVILYFLNLPVLPQQAMAWVIVIGVVAAAGLGASLVIRGIWDNGS